MALFKSGNPALNEKTFSKSISVSYDGAMTVKGTLNKFGVLFLLTMATAGLAWKMVYSGVDVTTYMWVSVFGAIGIALVMAFKMQWAAYLGPLYALVKGFAVGAISAYYNYAFEKIAPNIITQAVALTFGVVIAMFLLYKFNVIKATPVFKKIVITATLGIAVFYLISIGLHFANIDIPFLHEGSTFGIIFSLVVVGLAAMNLILDFDMIENGANMGAPKYMEWYCAFGLLVTIVWLYLEILRLLAKLAGDRK
ncbi:Bax inhibitor-1/YccA family protein [Longitalea arenae]|uniref:Bax inhibitor-1/YccA family protein n=1 Tax=Longitalea arenae TaxID=2812558 RepID=UPI0019679FC6|nr:Bax inhibitor-1/YccA family protein [Longitalea arenae]